MDGLLTGDLLDLVDGVIDCDLAVRGLAHAGGDHDLFETRTWWALVYSLALLKGRDNLVLVVLL
jgi:hypothetical protein